MQRRNHPRRPFTAFAGSLLCLLAFGSVLAADPPLTVKHDGSFPAVTVTFSLDPHAAEKAPDPVPLHKVLQSPQPALITMHYANESMSKVLADFASQTGSDMGLSRASVTDYIKNHRVSLDIDRADFWTALQVIQAKCGLHINASDNNATLTLEPDIQNPQGPQMFWRGPWQGNGGLDLLNTTASHAGMFLLLPNACMINRSVQYEETNSFDYNMNLSWSILAEPKFRILRRATDDNSSATLEECVDDRGRSLLTADSSCQLYNAQGLWMWQMAATLRDLPDARRIARVKGTVKFIVQTRSTVIDLSDINQADNLVRRGPFTFTFHAFDVTNHRIDIMLAGPMQGWTDDELQAIASAADLTDKDGAIYHFQDCQISDDDATHGKKLTFTFNTPGDDKSGPAQKFHWEVTTHTAVVATPFELHDLPLPQGPDGE